MLFSVVYMLLHIVQSLTLYGIRTISAYQEAALVVGISSANLSPISAMKC